MPRTLTQYAEDLDDVQNIPDGTAMYVQVRNPIGDVEAYARWAAFDADNAQWRLDNPGQPDPEQVPHAAVADENNIPIGEKLFVQARLLLKTQGADGLEKYACKWTQVNSTNFPTLDITAYRQALINIYNAQRVFEGLTKPA